MVFCVVGDMGHGKTTLIKALTGLEYDSYPEKKENKRVDVHFVPLKIEGREEIYLLDIPRDENFTTNLIRGLLGCSGALLCVDLREGVSPKTMENLQILYLLGLKNICCVLTKIDLVDESVINEIQEPLKHLLCKYGYDNVPIITASVQKKELESFFVNPPQSNNSEENNWFLPIDQVLLDKDKGITITGTLQGGFIQTKDQGILMPKKEEVVIRGLYQEGHSKETVFPFHRVDIILGKRVKTKLRKGDVFSKPGVIENSHCLDGKIRWIKVPKFGERIRISIGTEEIGGKVILFPNNDHIVQLWLDRKVGIKKGMPFILRSEGLLELLGGGNVLVVSAIRRPIVDRGLGRGKDLSEDIFNLLEGKSLNTDVLRKRVGATVQEFSGAIEDLKNMEKVIVFDNVCYDLNLFKHEMELFLDCLKIFHEENPSKGWVMGEVIIKKSNLPWKNKSCEKIFLHLKYEGLIKLKEGEVTLAAFIPQLKPKQQAILDKVKMELEKNGLETPYPSTLAQNLEIPSQALEAILKLGRETGHILLLPENIYYTDQQWNSILTLLKNMNPEGFSLADFKEAAGISRRYVLSILEYCDKKNITLNLDNLRTFKEVPVK